MLGIKQSVFGAFSRGMGENVKTQSGVNPLIMDDLAFVHTRTTPINTLQADTYTSAQNTPGRQIHIHTLDRQAHRHKTYTQSETKDKMKMLSSL